MRLVKWNRGNINVAIIKGKCLTLELPEGPMVIHGAVLFVAIDRPEGIQSKSKRVSTNTDRDESRIQQQSTNRNGNPLDGSFDRQPSPSESGPFQTFHSDAAIVSRSHINSFSLRSRFRRMNRRSNYLHFPIILIGLNSSGDEFPLDDQNRLFPKSHQTSAIFAFRFRTDPVSFQMSFSSWPIHLIGFVGTFFFFLISLYFFRIPEEKFAHFGLFISFHSQDRLVFTVAARHFEISKKKKKRERR